MGIKMMMTTKRIIAAVMLIAFFITSYSVNWGYAAEVPAQPAPRNLEIKPLNPNSEPPIGYSASDGGASGYYTDIGWGNVDNPQDISITGKYINIYLEEYAKGYRPIKPVSLKEKDMPAGNTPIRMRNLNSGTIYRANAKAYYEYINAGNSTRLKSEESASSNTVKFLTDINITCVTMDTSKIKIIWDDVWNNGKRINYKLYVSENKDFANTLPIYITEDQISTNGPVVLNQTGGTLEYVHSVKEPGRVYYVKIVPDISDPEIIRSTETKTVITSTYILVKTTKMSTSDDGTIWRLDWSPVVAGISSSDIKVQYQIDKFVGNVPIPMLVEDSNTTFITVPIGEQISYYMIRANVTKNGLPFYPDSVKIVSDKIILKEEEVSSTPPMPEIVPEIKDSTGAVIISYEDIINIDGRLIKKGELGKDTATVLWRTPKKADGTVDDNVLYDIWLIEDPSKIDDPPVATKIRSDFEPGEINRVRDVADNNNIIGYKYKLEGLLPNHTYYFKIVAKKVFPEEVEGVIRNVEYTSIPALKVVITLPGGAIDTPLIPSNPPLQIRDSVGNKKMITDNSVTIQLKNRWYEIFKPATGKWEYIRADKTTLNDSGDGSDGLYNPFNPDTPVDDLNFRKVQYDAGVTLYVGCEEYYEGIDIAAIDSYKLEKVPVTPNDEREDPTLNAPDSINSDGTPSYSKHNVVIPVNQLKSNTTYILWVRAARDGNPTLYSETSNPIIFTTLPTPEEIVEKPIVPTFTYSYAGDTFVDLGWEYKPGNTYYIKYGTVDDPSKAGNTISVTTSQILLSGVNYVRIPGLRANTQYYFWIQAETFSQDLSTSEKSDWSDSLPLRTLKDIPPWTPRGFGYKYEGVTKNSVIFEWIKEEGLEYILEVAGGVDYSDVKEYKAGSVSEFKVDGLKSNFRYFARLYAYDPTKKLLSIPTQSISFRTLRSSDDYDSDQDIDNVISGEFIDKATTVVNGTWTIKIVGVNADRLIQVMSTDNKLDYIVDVSKPPYVAKNEAKNISIIISKKVFDKLSQLKENIAFKTSVVTYELKAGIFSNVIQVNTQKEQMYIFNLVLHPKTPQANANELILRKPFAEIGVMLDTGLDKIEISKFSTPLTIKYPYTRQADYVEGKTFGFSFNTKLKNWEKLNSWSAYDVDNNSGEISFETYVPGILAVADRTSDLFDDIYGHVYEDSILNVAYIHKLKSIVGRMFEPDKEATVGDAVRIVLDTLGYSYGTEYMVLAAKAGFIKGDKQSGDICTVQEAAAMATVLYERKTNMKAIAAEDIILTYSDYSQIDKAILNKVTFAVENGFVPETSSAYLNPRQAVTRGELMYMLEKALALAGEIE